MASTPRVPSPFGLELLLQASVPLGFAVGLATIIAATFLVDAPLPGLLGAPHIQGRANAENRKNECPGRGDCA
jgi:hypothetical protein